MDTMGVVMGPAVKSPHDILHQLISRLYTRPIILNGVIVTGLLGTALY
jgi:hypothetical protein